MTSVLFLHLEKLRGVNSIHPYLLPSTEQGIIPGMTSGANVGGFV